MYLLQIPLVACLVSLLGTSLAQDANCDFRQNVVPGQTYYVYSPNYPSNYSSGIQCRWIGVCPSGYHCRLDCEVRLPYTTGCTQDRLLISKTGDPQLNNAEKYCGVGSVTAVSSGPSVSVGLLVSSTSKGGRFLCRLTAQISSPIEDTCRCGYKKSNRIVGGVETGVNEYPMMAALVDRQLVKITCGGAIASPRYVITAAHCVTGKQVTDFAVVVGEHDVTKGDSPATQGFEVSSITIHPLWDDRTYDYDIAVITLKKDIQFSDRVGPVCLPFKFINNDFAGKNITALGWGTIYSGGPDSDVLLKVDIQVISQGACQATNPPFLSPRQMCTLTLGKDTCQDDSGGPLLFTDPATGLLFYAGIVSAGRGCGGRSPSINTRVTAFLDWILSVTNYKYCMK